MAIKHDYMISLTPSMVFLVFQC